MKIAGHDKLGHAQQIVLLKRGDKTIELRLTALPIGYYRAMLAELPEPQSVRTGIAKDAKGNRLRDPDTDELLFETNANSPALKAMRDEWQNRASAYRIALGLRDDPNVKFEATPGSGLPAYCDAILAELAEAGFGERDLYELNLATMALSSDVQTATDAAKNG